ncbi:MAG: outer membrane beta-barrel protein [Candidatus Methylomirabilia bacterium]
MKKTLALTAALFMTLALCASDSFAQGLLGMRTLSVSYGNMFPGNDVLRRIDDASTQIGLKLNYPVLQNLDAFASLGYSQLKGNLPGENLESNLDTKRIDAGVAYQFFPGQAFNPFVRGSVGYVSKSGANNSDNQLIPGFPEGDKAEGDVAYGIGGGIEVPFGGQFAASLGFDYAKAGDVDDFVGFVDMNGWFNKVLFAGLGFSYGINEGDFAYYTNIGFGF